MNAAPPCRIVTVVTFPGSRSRAFVATFLKALDAEKNASGPGPSPLDGLLYAGHTGVSLDSGKTVLGFHPDTGNLPAWQALDRLKRGEAFPGVVTDDTAVFAAAGQGGLAVQSFDVLFPDAAFQRFQDAVLEERRQSRLSYGFPDGNGDCNCTTWLERLGLPLLTGRMSEFAKLPGIAAYPSRRFGECI
jgi:hypothetical protein